MSDNIIAISNVVTSDNRLTKGKMYNGLILNIKDKGIRFVCVDNTGYVMTFNPDVFNFLTNIKREERDMVVIRERNCFITEE